MVHSCKNCTSLGMPYKCNVLTSKQKHIFSKVLFACKHQVVVWNRVFSKHFEALHTGKDGLRWVTFSAEKVGQLIFYYYISRKLLFTSILKSKKVIVWRTMAQNTWRGMMQGEEMLDKISIVHWMSLQTLPYFVQHQWQTVEYCHRKYASEEVSITNAVYWWMDVGTQYL